MLLLLYDGGDYLACLNVLLEAGADVNVPTRYQKTALHIAAECSTADVVAALLKAGAHVNPEDNHKKTPLHKACSRFDYDAGPALLLIRNGADVNAICGTGFPYTPLDFAIGARFHRRLVPILLRAGATPPRTYGPVTSSGGTSGK